MVQERSIPLYPAKLRLIDGDHANARVTIATPSMLPLSEFWVSVGASMGALSQGYGAAKEFLRLSEGTANEWNYGSFVRDDSGRIHFHSVAPTIIGGPTPEQDSRPGAPVTIGGASTEEDLQGDVLHIVRLNYNSPINIDLVVGFATAFSLVGALATGAITTAIKLLEWREKKKELQDEDRRRDLEIEKLRLELEERKTEIEQRKPGSRVPAVTALSDPEMVLVQQLLFVGAVLAGQEQAWIDPSLHGLQARAHYEKDGLPSQQGPSWARRD